VLGGEDVVDCAYDVEGGGGDLAEVSTANSWNGG
jgi:hypothetical protein